MAQDLKFQVNFRVTQGNTQARGASSKLAFSYSSPIYVIKGQELILRLSTASTANPSESLHEGKTY